MDRIRSFLSRRHFAWRSDPLSTNETQAAFTTGCVPPLEDVRTLSDLSKVFQTVKRLCCSGEPTNQPSIGHFLGALFGFMVPAGFSGGSVPRTDDGMERLLGCTSSRK